MKINTARGSSDILVIHIPLKLKRRYGRKEVILPAGVAVARPEMPLQAALIRAYRWQQELDTGRASSVKEIAQQNNVDYALVARSLRLLLLAPDIIEEIRNGNESEQLSLSILRRQIPLLWEEQRELYGFPVAAC